MLHLHPQCRLQLYIIPSCIFRTLPHRLGFCLTFPFRPVRNSHLWPAIVTNGMALEPLATEKVNLIDGPKALHFTMYVNV